MGARRQRFHGFSGQKARPRRANHFHLLLWFDPRPKTHDFTLLGFKASTIRRFTPTDDAVTKAKDLTVSRFLQGETDPGRLVKCQDPGAGKE